MQTCRRTFIAIAALLAAACRDGGEPPTGLPERASHAVTAAGSARLIYFTEAGTGKVWKVRMDASGVVVSAVPIYQRTSPVGIAINASGTKIYWTDNGTNRIESGTTEAPFIVDPPLLTGLAGPLGLAIDTKFGQVYWIEESGRTINRINLNGTERQTLVSTGLGDPRYLALDIGNRNMYWTDASFDRIQRSKMNGANPTTIVAGQIGPYGIALDVPSNRMYWADNSLGTIQYANLDGSNVQPPFITGHPAVGIALDLVGGRIYWANNAAGKIQRANLDGSNIEDLVTGLVNPHGIAIR
jgi:DNA-binding beta-propeller fold protein YncE